MTGDLPPQLYPIAIGRYHQPGHAQLHDPHATSPNGVEAEIVALAEILSDFGVVTTDWPTPMAERDHRAVTARIAEWAATRGRPSVLYWVGHGGADALAHADSPTSIVDDGILIAPLARAIAKRHPDTTDYANWSIVVVDACRSRRFVQALGREGCLADVPALLIGTSGEGATTLGRFTRQLRDVLRFDFGRDSHVSVFDLGRALQKDSHRAVEFRRLGDAVLRRDRPAITGSPLDVLTEIDTVLARLPENERRHFVEKAQGGEHGEQSWYFEGRHDESRAISAWLRTERQGMLVVTGPPGGGKSALFGHLLLHSQPRLRDILTAHELTTARPADEQPPDDVFDVAVHLTGLSTTDLTHRLARDLNLDPPPTAGPTGADVDWLIDSLAGHDPVTILVDALDEAVDPLTVASAVLRRLATTSGVRLVVGTRRSIRDQPDRPAGNDRDLLDALAVPDSDPITVTHDGIALGDYVGKRLFTAAERGALTTDGRSISRVVSRVSTSGKQFLYGRLLVHTLLAEPDLLNPSHASALDQLLDDDHQALFGRAVQRLTHTDDTALPLLRALAYSRGRGLPIRDHVWATTATALANGHATPDERIHHLLDAAAPYITGDREHHQTVYRLAHRTFVEHFTDERTPTAADQAAHHAITRHLLAAAAQERPDKNLNPYLEHHLTGHVGLAGRTAWEHLADHPSILDRLDPDAVTADAFRTAFGHHPLPPPIAGVIGSRHHAVTASPTDRRGLRQLAMTQHTNDNRPGQHEPNPANHWSVQWAAQRRSPTHLTLTGHTAWVRAVAAVPVSDGRTLLATGGDDGLVRLWDPATGESVGEPLTGHAGGVLAVAAVPVPNGRTLLAIGSNDELVRLWDPATGWLVGEPLTGHTGAVWAVAAVPVSDGRTLLATGSDDGSVRLWDPATGESVGEPLTGHTDWVWAVAAVSVSDGRTLLATGGDDGLVRLWDPATGRLVGEPLTGHTGRVWAVAAVPVSDGPTLLATGGDDGLVRLWDPATGESVGEPLTGHAGGVLAVAAVPVPDGRTLLATGSADRTVRLWDLSTGQSVGEPLTRHTDWVRAVATVPVPDGRTLLATGSDDRTVRLWDPATGQSVGESLTGHTGRVWGVVPVPDGRTLLATGSNDRTVRLWDPATGQSVGEPLTGHTGRVLAVAAVPVPDGRTLLATGDDDGLVRLWDPATGRLVGEPLTGHTGGVLVVAAVPVSDGRTLLATGSDDRTVRLWDPATGQPVGEPLTGHTGRVRAVAAVPVPDGRTLLATVGDDGSIRLWDAATGQPVGEPLSGHTGWVLAVAAVPVPDGRTLLAIGSADGSIRLWDPATGQPGVLSFGQQVDTIAYFNDDRVAVATHIGVAVVSLGHLAMCQREVSRAAPP